MDLGRSFRNTTDTIFGFLPNILGFLIILLVGYIVAKVVATVVRKLLDKANIDQRLGESDARKYVDAALPGSSAERAIAAVVFWFIFIFFIVTAIGALDIPAATGFMDQVLAFLPNVIVAILIFVIAALVSGAVGAGVAKFMGDTPTGKIVAGVVPAVVMVIAFFMILEQLQIAPEIVRIAFAAVMFALALGLALAFGLGGRDVAARLLEDAQAKGREAARQAKQDVAQGRERAEQQFGGAGSSSSTASQSAGYTSPYSSGDSGSSYGSGQGGAPDNPEGGPTQQFPTA